MAGSGLRAPALLPRLAPGPVLGFFGGVSPGDRQSSGDIVSTSMARRRVASVVWPGTAVMEVAPRGNWVVDDVGSNTVFF